MTADSIILTRKAHSATKFSEVEQILSMRDFKINSRVQCSSASSYSNREKFKKFRSCDMFDCDSHENLKCYTHNNKKVFLQASQILAKLEFITTKYDDTKLVPKDNEHRKFDSQTHDIKFNLRKINFYYDLLKRLLEERCILLLNEEILSCFEKAQKLVSDLKLVYSNEVVKLTTMPIKTYNRFVDSAGLSISILQHLFRKVNFICDLYSSLKNNYQSIISFFHVGFDMGLNQMLLKIYKLHTQLYSELFYWTHKILEIFILKLCLANPHSVSPEFLHHLLETCESFNLLLLNKKHLTYINITYYHHVLFNCFLKPDYEMILLDFILEYLSRFESKVAAEKIIHFLIYECKNHGQVILKEKYIENDKGDIRGVNSITSDYYSDSPVVEGENSQIHTFMNSIFNFENVFHSFIQRNQSLVLKYLYSIACLDITASRNHKRNVENSSSIGSKSWNLPQNGSNRNNFHCLEERFWVKFWEKVLVFSLKLVLEVPCHQYGNSTVGVFLFWPHSYHHIIFKFLKSCTEARDIPLDGLDIMKKMFHILYIQSMNDSWDENMSSTLSIIYGQYCVPIPTASERVRTRIGNSLCTCVETLQDGCLNDLAALEYFYFKLEYPLLVTLDCLIFLINSKARACISSGDITTYLLISRSDCVHVCNLLERRKVIVKENMSRKCYGQGSSFSKQFEILFGHAAEVSNLMYKIVFDAVREIILFKIRIRCRLLSNFGNLLNSRNIYSSLKEILNSFAGTISHIYDGTDLLPYITSAVANGMLSVLHELHKKLSLKKVQIVNDTVSEFLAWLEQLNIENSEIEKLKDMKCLKKLLCVIQILQSSTTKPRSCERHTNKVAPLMTETCLYDENLAEDEKLRWFMSRDIINHICFCF